MNDKTPKTGKYLILFSLVFFGVAAKLLHKEPLQAAQPPQKPLVMEASISGEETLSELIRIFVPPAKAEKHCDWAEPEPTTAAIQMPKIAKKKNLKKRIAKFSKPVAMKIPAPVLEEPQNVLELSIPNFDADLEIATDEQAAINVEKISESPLPEARNPLREPLAEATPDENPQTETASTIVPTLAAQEPSAEVTTTDSEPALPTQSVVEMPIAGILVPKDFSQHRTLLSAGEKEIDSPTNEIPPAPPAPEPVPAQPEDEQRGGDADNSDAPMEDHLMGEVQMDAPMQKWLDDHQGYIELALLRVNSQDPLQDAIQLDFQHPDTEFDFDMTDVAGTFRLAAKVFTSEARTSVAHVFYPRKISHETIKQKVRFYITKAALESAMSRNGSNHSANSLSVSLFEGAAGNYRKPPSIKNGQVKVVGFPEWGTLTTDAMGTVRLPQAPAHSEFLFEAVAEGYFRTRQIVPTFLTNGYSPLYLISKEKADTITRFFTKSVQSEKYGLVLGRSFQPSSRVPLAGEKLSILPSTSSDRPYYFGALPDPALAETTSTGMFGFFNVAPSVRAFVRANHQRALLMDIQPGTAQYVEIGRGGSRRLLGRIVSPLETSLGVAKVRLVGDKTSETTTDEKGNFEMPGIDLGPGLLTLEVEVPGYPKTWHSFGWSPREPDRRKYFHILPEEVIDESAAQVVKLKRARNQGAIVGGADPAFFEGGANCVNASLFDNKGTAVVKGKGPFPFSTKQGSSTEMTECLTAQAPGFAFYNLPDGEYILKWTSPDGKPLRAHVIRVGQDRVSISVN